MFHPPLIIAAFSVFLLVGCAAPPQRTTLPPLPDLTAYLLVDPATDAVLSVEQAAAALADADVVFLGETHRHPGNHLAQMALFRALHTQNADTALSLE